MAQLSAGAVIAVDGKTLRHSYDRGQRKGASHIVSAWAAENRLVLGQGSVDEKSNESTAIRELLKVLALNLLSQESSAKIGKKAKRLKAGWDDDYLTKVLTSAG